MLYVAIVNLFYSFLCIYSYVQRDKEFLIKISSTLQRCNLEIEICNLSVKLKRNDVGWKRNALVYYFIIKSIKR